MIRIVGRAIDTAVEALGIVAIGLGLARSPSRGGGYRMWPWVARIRERSMYGVLGIRGIRAMIPWMQHRYSLNQALRADILVLQIRVLEPGLDQQDIRAAMIRSGDPEHAIELAEGTVFLMQMGHRYRDAIRWVQGVMDDDQAR